MRRPTFRRPPAVVPEGRAPFPPRGATMARVAVLLGGALGVGFLIGALSGGPAAADTTDRPAGSEQRGLHGVRPAASLDGPVGDVADLVTGPSATARPHRTPDPPVTARPEDGDRTPDPPVTARPAAGDRTPGLPVTA
ncbi:hypothetical protein NCC78_06050, partial [Micromonospora phytophila]|nr:hypothetical protein [Micromonospora phytophila]